MATNIIIADDHALIREGVKRLIEAEGDLHIVGEATTANGVLELVQTVRADLLLLDINMPGRSGLDILGQLRQEHPNMRILILSMLPEDSIALLALRSGASGYLTKEAVPQELVRAIRQIHAGSTYISAQTADSLVDELRSGSTQLPLHSLSEREFEVFRLLATGVSTKTISETLHISPPTVSTYRARVMEKLKLKSNADLIHYALKNHIIE